MEPLLEEQRKLSRKGNLSKSLEDIQRTIDMLESARASIISSPKGALLTLAKLQNPTNQSFEKINGDLKEVYNGLGKYAKALDKKFKDKPLPTTGYKFLESHDILISRALGMHFLREGQFNVASTFLSESSRRYSRQLGSTLSKQYTSWKQDSRMEPLHPESLRKQFGDMYHILEEMKTKRNLLPAAAWARDHSSKLEASGSNLEFELGRLQFLWLFEQGQRSDRVNNSAECQKVALAYARRQFGRFQGRYLRDIQQLIGAMAFCPNLQQSPYRQFFHNEGAWEDVAMSFTREFCSLLGLSADSPVYIAITAGVIALPTLQKLDLIMATKHTEWTTNHELAVEIPLPASYRFHSIFVCPVSKEQTTDENPPMMMPCGHVIAQESMGRLSKVSRFKCPYCPSESQPKDARKIFL